jgi:hypothetical protein
MGQEIRYSTTYKLESSSSGRPLILMHIKPARPYLYYNRLPEDEPTGSKYVEDVKIKN